MGAHNAKWGTARNTLWAGTSACMQTVFFLSGLEAERGKEWSNQTEWREDGGSDGSGSGMEKWQGCEKLRLRREGKRWERECEGVSSHLCVLFSLPLRPGRIGFDMHELVLTAPLPEVPSTYYSQPSLMWNSTHLTRCQNTSILFRI